MRTLAAAALVAVLLCALQAVRATNTDDIYYAMDAIDSGWGLGFRNKFGDPAKTCNCSFVGGGSDVYPCQWTRLGRTNVTEGFFCGVVNGESVIDSVIFHSPVPAAPGAIIPTYIGLLTTVRQLSLRGVGIAGVIPSEINLMTSLQTLVIAGNSLSLGIPDMSALTALTKLSLSSNGLVGNVPDTLGLLTGLQEVSLDGNRLEGAVDFVQTLASLTAIRFENNMFSGTIPNAIGQLPALQNLFLSNNMFTGDVPPSFLTMPAKNCDVQLNNLNNCWDPAGLKATFAPACVFNCRPCQNGLNGPPDCSCLSTQPNPAHCSGGTWLFGSDLVVNGSNPLNLFTDKATVTGTLTQTSTGPIKVYVTAPKTFGAVTVSGCVTLGGPVYVEMTNVTTAYSLDVITSQGGCISGNFSRVIVTDSNGPACPRKTAYAKITPNVATIVVPAAKSCVGPAQSNSGPRITKPILVGIILGTIAGVLALVGLVLLVVFLKRSSNSHTRL